MLIIHNDAIELILTFNLILRIQGITIWLIMASKNNGPKFIVALVPISNNTIAKSLDVTNC